MTTFNTLVSAVKAIIAPMVKAPATSKSGDVPQVRMAPDRAQFSKRAVEDYSNNGSVQLQQAQIRLADALGANRQAIAASEARQAKAHDFVDLVVIQAERGGAVREGEKLQVLGRLAGRMAANSTASNEDRVRFGQLVKQATSGQVSPSELGRLVAQAEDIARNAGRDPISDRGLANATQGLVAKLGQLEEQIGDLEQAAGDTRSAEELQKLQMKIVDLQLTRGTLVEFKAQADRLANRRGASPEDLASMKTLLSGAIQMTAADERRAFLTEAEFVARNAGGPAGDRAVHEATKGLAVKLGQVEQAISDLTDAAQGTVSSEELQKIQIKVMDLARDRETLRALKREADRAVNGRDELDLGDRGRLLHGLNAAKHTDSPETLYRILGELRTIGK